MKSLDELTKSDQKWAADRAQAAKAIFQQYQKKNLSRKEFESMLSTLIREDILDKDFNPDYQELRNELTSVIQNLIDTETLGSN